MPDRKRRLIFLLLPFSIFLILSRTGNLLASQPDRTLVEVDKWSFPEIKLHGYIFDARIDDDDNLIIMFFKDGIFAVSKSAAYPISRYGEGPGEIRHWKTMCLNQTHLVDVETTGKLLFFKKVGSLYQYDKVEWIKGLNNVFVESAEQHNGRWFFAGFCYDHEASSKKRKAAGHFISVFENGELKVKLLYREFPQNYYAHLIRSFIRKKDDRFYVMIETEPKIYELDPEKLKITKEIKLKTPANFVPAKEGTFLKRPDKPTPYLYEEWELSYSRVEKFLISKDYLIVQIRNPMEQQGRFELLFYNPGSFVLEKSLFINDVLLAEKNGFYYFLENGDPGLDEEADKLVINIYKLR
ncbi:MAG TPA: hypothetical protein PK266_07175 [Candidatus Saccharicenans sp.]|nr:hypothetical protein [Candidatus Saccharicenans sp.]HUM79912.1 hypothetical protein [Candidatus Saccharicenans sp.]